MPAAAIKSFWMNGSFPPFVRKLLVAAARIRPVMSAVQTLRPLFATTFISIRTFIVATIARIRHDDPEV